MRRIFALSVLVSTAAFAQATQVTPDLRDVGTARSIAMGGAYESLGYGSESIGGNPAALGLYKRYLIEASGAWDIPNGYGFGSIGLADSTNELQAGVQYTFATYGGLQRRYAHITTLASSYAFGNIFSVGAALRYNVITGASNTNSVTMNAGIVVRPVQQLMIGISGHNLIGVYNKDVSRYFVGSIGAQFFDQLTPVIDVRLDFNQRIPKWAIHGGLEWLIANMIPIRAGYEYDGIASPNHHYISFGAGWFYQGSGIDIAYRHEIKGLNGREIVLTLKLQL